MIINNDNSEKAVKLIHTEHWLENFSFEKRLLIILGCSVTHIISLDQN